MTIDKSPRKKQLEIDLQLKICDKNIQESTNTSNKKHTHKTEHNASDLAYAAAVDKNPRAQLGAPLFMTPNAHTPALNKALSGASAASATSGATAVV